jgi:hypothetical protein
LFENLKQCQINENENKNKNTISVDIKGEDASNLFDIPFIF